MLRGRCQISKVDSKGRREERRVEAAVHELSLFIEPLNLQSIRGKNRCIRLCSIDQEMTTKRFFFSDVKLNTYCRLIQQMAITTVGTSKAPTVSSNQMAISPSVCPASHINMNRRKSISIDDEKRMSSTYVVHIVDTFFADPKMKTDHHFSFTNMFDQ